MPRVAHGRVRTEQVLQALAVEGRAHHHFPIASPRREHVQVIAVVAARREEVRNQAVRRKGAGGRQVVGRHVVAEHQQRMRGVAAQLAGRLHRGERRTPQRGGGRVPRKARGIR
ncbi:hypothetical protein G6F32_016012 [Rhizopus arrhizus]|nr:hypothetical protein G6F32_016012 [Rhizopus arrhizus]